ncbi:MAG: hypothetical protein WKF75_08985 [Singulisphaera sp.]
MPGASDALKAARDAPRRLDLADEVHRTHVDAQLQRRGRHHRRQLAPLQRLLGPPALVQAQAAVMRPHDRRRLLLVPSGQLIQVRRQPLDDPAIVREDDRRAMRADHLQQPTLDGRPDRAPAGGRPGRRGR